MSMKISSENIGNRTRDLPACSALLAQLRHRLPRALFYIRQINVLCTAGDVPVRISVNRPSTLAVTVVLGKEGQVSEIGQSRLHSPNFVKIMKNKTSTSMYTNIVYEYTT